jgi:alkyldihydroxyacetonephosphate synthase
VPRCTSRWCAPSPTTPVSQWRQAKQAANAAILSAGGTISHHHGVGTDHVAGLAEELGPLMVDTLRAVKHGLDPAGILNPGILLASGGGGP